MQWGSMGHGGAYSFRPAFFLPNPLPESTRSATFGHFFFPLGFLLLILFFFGSICSFSVARNSSALFERVSVNAVDVTHSPLFSFALCAFASQPVTRMACSPPCPNKTDEVNWVLWTGNIHPSLITTRWEGRRGENKGTWRLRPGSPAA